MQSISALNMGETGTFDKLTVHLSIYIAYIIILKEILQRHDFFPMCASCAGRQMMF